MLKTSNQNDEKSEKKKAISKPKWKKENQTIVL